MFDVLLLLDEEEKKKSLILKNTCAELVLRECERAFCSIVPINSFNRAEGGGKKNYLSTCVFECLVPRLFSLVVFL